jgi:hypothetical protein
MLCFFFIIVITLVPQSFLAALHSDKDTLTTLAAEALKSNSLVRLIRHFAAGCHFTAAR